MRKYQIISILFLLISCNQDESAMQLKGAWCNEINHCIYFDGKYCIVDNAEINQYKISGENEIELNKIEKPNRYQFEIENSTLRIRNYKNEEFRTFKKKESIQNYEIQEIQFSSITPNLEIELEIDNDSKMKIRIHHHMKFEPGNYIGEIPKPLQEFIAELVRASQLEIKANLKNQFVSDINEWSLMIKTNKENRLYYNYKDVTTEHLNIINILIYLPYFVELERTSELLELDEIRNFRTIEFNRNLKENDL